MKRKQIPYAYWSKYNIYEETKLLRPL